MSFERSELPSGIRVVTERIPGVRSLSAGAWVGVGSRDEPEALGGATHFLEHLLFKGTATRTARDIAEEFDAVGGDINAFTAREYTCFHTRTLDSDAPMAVEIAGDMLRASLLAEGDIEAERQVVLQEISMHEDTPDDLVHDLFLRTAWDDHALARPVEGTAGTITAMRRDDVERYWRTHYTPGGMVFAAAGSVDHARFVESVEKAFGDAAASRPAPVRGGGDAPALLARASVRERDIEQSHIVWGTEGMRRADPRRWALMVLHTALGAGMSSRLFQEVRERRGLVYAIWTGHATYAECGLFSVYAATAPGSVREVLDTVRDEVAAVAGDGITEEELARCKGHLRGSLMLSLEDPGGRMWHLGKGELCQGEILEPPDVISRIEAVTLEVVREVARDVLGEGRWALTVLGPEHAGDLDSFAGRLE